MLGSKGAIVDSYRRFIAGPTLNIKKKVVFFGNYHLMLLKSFKITV